MMLLMYALTVATRLMQHNHIFAREVTICKTSLDIEMIRVGCTCGLKKVIAIYNNRELDAQTAYTLFAMQRAQQRRESEEQLEGSIAMTQIDAYE